MTKIDKNRKSLSLTTQTIRTLQDAELRTAAGGYTRPSEVRVRSCTQSCLQ